MPRLAVTLTLFLLMPTLALASTANVFKQIFAEATVAYNKGDYLKASELYNKTIEMYEGFAPSHNYLGLALKSMDRDIEEVVKHFERAVELDPNYADAYVNLGKIYYNEGDFDLAEENCLKALEIMPDHFNGQLALAWLYLLGKSEPRKSIPLFEKAIKTQETSLANFGLGIAYFMDGQNFQVLERITALRKANEEPWAQHLEQMVRKGRYEPPKIAGTALLAPQKQESILVEDIPDGQFLSSQDGAGIQVRLKDKRGTTGRFTSSPPQNSNNSGFTINHPQSSSTAKPSNNPYRNVSQPKGSGY